MSTKLPPLSPEEEALMHRKIAEQIEPYRAFTPPALLDLMRQEAEQAMRTHPDARVMLAAAVRRPAPDVSGEATKGALPDDHDGTGEKGGA
jgi:hypothetical protein